MKEINKKSKKVLLITLVVLTAMSGILVVYQRVVYMTFYEDRANHCDWENGKVVLQTEAAPRNTKVLVRKNDVQNYIMNAQRKGVCTGNEQYPMHP